MSGRRRVGYFAARRLPDGCFDIAYVEGETVVQTRFGLSAEGVVRVAEQFAEERGLNVKLLTQPLPLGTHPEY